MSQSSPSKPEPKQFFQRGVLGFYVCCTLAGLAASVASIAWVLFRDKPGTVAVTIVSVVVTVLAGVGSWYYLAVSRRER